MVDADAALVAWFEVELVEGNGVLVVGNARALRIALFVGNADFQGIFVAAHGRPILGSPLLLRHDGEFLKRIGVGGGGAYA